MLSNDSNLFDNQSKVIFVEVFNFCVLQIKVYPDAIDEFFE